MIKKKKVVIVGGGINGLVAANYLSKDGFSVSIIEKNPIVGGACTFRTKKLETKPLTLLMGLPFLV